jgi:pimeloyl-ACP methyl ester carboxylesterase
MIEGSLVLVHGFWSSPATWRPMTNRIQADEDLRGLRVFPFGYESPKLRMPMSPARIPRYDDIAQTLGAALTVAVPGGPTAIVTHSQGGLILQRFLAWMLNEGRGRELERIRLIVMLACPNEGAEYLRSIRAVLGFRRHPQAGELHTLNADAADARRAVLRGIVNAHGANERECRIPTWVYAGRTDNVVTRASAQSAFPNAGSLPGDHFSILDPDKPGDLTFPALKRHILDALTGTVHQPAAAQPQAGPGPADDQHVGSPAVSPSKYDIRIAGSQGIQIGDGNTQHNTFR